MNNSLAAVHPELIAEWSDRNLPLTPDSVTFGSNKKVWWNNHLEMMSSFWNLLQGILTLFTVQEIL